MQKQTFVGRQFGRRLPVFLTLFEIRLNGFNACHSLRANLEELSQTDYADLVDEFS